MVSVVGPVVSVVWTGAPNKSAIIKTLNSLKNWMLHYKCLIKKKKRIFLLKKIYTFCWLFIVYVIQVSVKIDWNIFKGLDHEHIFT